MKPHALSILLASLVVAACSNANGPNAKDPEAAYIRGYITARDSGGVGVRDADGTTRVVYYPRVLVEENPLDPVSRGTTKKSRVSWGPQTQFTSRSGQTLSASDLGVGQFVAVWISGVVLDSYPDQVGATRIILESQ
jgi:hypothetical protein